MILASLLRLEIHIKVMIGRLSRSESRQSPCHTHPLWTRSVAVNTNVIAIALLDLEKLNVRMNELSAGNATLYTMPQFQSRHLLLILSKQITDADILTFFLVSGSTSHILSNAVDLKISVDVSGYQHRGKLPTRTEIERNLLSVVVVR